MKNERKGISLIVLIVTIIVIIILASVVILTLSKNNPIESAREAKFKEDIGGFQDELTFAISKEYQESNGFRDSKINLEGYDNIKTKIPSFTKEYAEFLAIENDEIVCTNNEIGEKKSNWLKELSVEVYINNVPKEWRNTIEDITEDGVPIPKGFTYLTGTKNTGVVIKDSIGNEFVWVPATVDNYVRDYSFPRTDENTGDTTYSNNLLCDGTLPSGIADETVD